MGKAMVDGLAGSLDPVLAAAPRGHAGVDTIEALTLLGRVRRGAIGRARAAIARRDPAGVPWLVELDPVQMGSAAHELHRELLEAALPLVEDRPAWRSDLLRLLGRAWAVRGVLGLAQRLLDEAVASAPAGDPRRRAAALGLRAYARIGLGQLVEAEEDRAAAQAAAGDLERRGERLRFAAFSAQCAGLTARARGDGPGARAALTMACDLAREAGADRMVALAHANLADVQPDRSSRERHLHAARALFVALGDRLHVVRVDLARARHEGDGAALLAAGLEAEGLGDHEGAAAAFLARAALALGGGGAARRELDRAWRSLARCDVAALVERALALESTLRDGEARLVVERGATWVTFVDGAGAAGPPGATAAAAGPDGARARSIDLSRRRALPGVLAGLAAAGPGRSLTVTELFEAGWPGERATPSSAAARVYVAVRTLRALGLARAIVTTPAGYRLADGLRVEVRG